MHAPVGSIVSSKFVHPGPVSPRLRPNLPTSVKALYSALFVSLVIIFGSPRCLAGPFQQQSAAVTQPAPPTPEEVHPLIKTAAAKQAATSPTIVIGFLGGHVKKNNAVHTEVQVAMHLRHSHPVGVHAEVFQNTEGPAALREILRLLDVNHDGVLSDAEKLHARIILYGHSWGASETVTLAHHLQSEGIPVLLTVLVDRVSKIGEGDESIPANVAQAVNFYQLDGLLHGWRTIRAADPASTQILGNYQFDYKNNPVSCDQYPWYARLFMGPHIEIENDPRVWNQVEALINSRLPPEQSPPTVALIGQPH
jgi:hypothetical protein